MYVGTYLTTAWVAPVKTLRCGTILRMLLPPTPSGLLLFVSSHLLDIICWRNRYIAKIYSTIRGSCSWFMLRPLIACPARPISPSSSAPPTRRACSVESRASFSPSLSPSARPSTSSSCGTWQPDGRRWRRCPNL